MALLRGYRPSGDRVGGPGAAGGVGGWGDEATSPGEFWRKVFEEQRVIQIVNQILQLLWGDGHYPCVGTNGG